MIITLFQDFELRSKEVSKYFIFLKNLEQGTVQLSMQDRGRKPKIQKINSDLEKTLKASGFLLLYNLVESTMRNAIEVIFDELRSQKISFDEVRADIKKIVLKNFKKCSTDKILENITKISLDIIAVSFDKEKLFSGNIDGKLIKEIAKEFGFSCKTDFRKTGDGKDLLTVKTNRNDLAHGIKSFAEVGRDKSADELLKIKSNVVKYLRGILLNIQEYLSNQEYLKP
ncbi:MAE_28990/MAE_18760 family HEPN-like nuclease [Synechocystis sp. PCC 7509]|uniref:MAE_28990/MAE_18760 family HEPN-like nuclease n=1 Tax=Synechocystis sp. PCC 7509 TaxID=927677 RepID=UPI0002ACD8DE|nr:MAE_28990/MAE_18760 family HEPN-like nuclease [Synechocystis sp. PCC 7509]